MDEGYDFEVRIYSDLCPEPIWAETPYDSGHDDEADELPF